MGLSLDQVCKRGLRLWSRGGLMSPIAAKGGRRKLFIWFLIWRQERMIIGQRIWVLIFSLIEAEQKEESKGFLLWLPWETQEEWGKKGGGSSQQSCFSPHAWWEQEPSLNDWLQWSPTELQRGILRSLLYKVSLFWHIFNLNCGGGGRVTLYSTLVKPHGNLPTLHSSQDSAFYCELVGTLSATSKHTGFFGVFFFKWGRRESSAPLDLNL